MLKATNCQTITCDVCDYTLDEDDDGIYHFETTEDAFASARDAGWWATETAILCTDNFGIEHTARAAEVADEIERGDSDGKRLAEFMTWCEKTGHEIEGTSGWDADMPGQGAIEDNNVAMDATAVTK